MKRFIEGENRSQSTLFPERLDDYIAEDNAVRVVDAFVDKLDLKQLGFDRAEPSDTGRPGYQPATMLKIYVYGYLNRIQSSRRLERESYRNVELIWLTGRLMPSFKTIADFSKDNKQAIRRVCVEFVGVCRELELFSATLVAIDGSKFKAVNSRDKNFTQQEREAQAAKDAGEHRPLPGEARCGGPGRAGDPGSHGNGVKTKDRLDGGEDGATEGTRSRG